MISLRLDFPHAWRGIKLRVVEIAIGLDRCVFSFEHFSQMLE